MALALKKNMPKRQILVYKGIALTLICIFIFYAGRSLVSTILTIRPATSVLNWEQKKEPLNEELALTLLERVKNSVAIDPSNADHNFLLARLYELLAFRDDQLISQANLNLANKFYHRAIVSQPTAYLAWARLAALNSKTGDDNSAIIALEKAISFGTYENENQRLLIPIIIKYWSTANFVEDNTTTIRQLFSHTLKFRINHTWLLNRVLQSKNISLLRFTFPLIEHQDQLDKFNEYVDDRPQLKLKFVRQAHE